MIILKKHFLKRYFNCLITKTSYKEEEFDENEFPQSYKSNNASEKKLLIIVENFCKQYSTLYKDRKSLFITPSNEFGVPVIITFY